MAACELLEAEFKILVKGMFSELRKRIDELIEKFRREICMEHRKNALQGISNRLEKAEG